MSGFKKNVSKFIAVSYAEKNEVIKRGVPDSKIEVVYNGISEKYSRIVRENAEKPSQKKVLYLGRLTRTKNPELIVKAIAQITKTDSNVKLILAGPDFGELRNLEELVSRLGIKKHVEFTGEVTEKEKMQLLASCDVFVHPSLQDIFSLSILEASAAALPVVAFNIGGNSEMIIDGQTGVLVDSLTPDGIADAVLKILYGDFSSVQSLGKKGREYVSNKFSWDATADKLVEIYQEITF